MMAFSASTFRWAFDWMAVKFEKLPDLKRVAIQYYIKGRVDAAADNIEIPISAATKAVWQG